MNGRNGEVSPATAREVQRVVADILDMQPEEFFLADHTHEGLSAGSWSLAFEGFGGDQDWPQIVTEAKFKDPSRFPPNVFIEPLSSWGLGIYHQECHQED